MTTDQMTAKQALIEAVNGMTEEEAEDLLDLLNMRDDPDELSPDEVARFTEITLRMDAGDYVTLEDHRATRPR